MPSANAAPATDFELPAALQPADIAAAPPADPAVRGRLLRQLFVLGRSTQVSAFLAAVFTEGIFYALTRSPGVLVWAALIHLAQGLRWVGIRTNERIYPAPAFDLGQPAGAWRYLAPLTAAACAWGAAAWLLLPVAAAGTTYNTILVVLVFGMLAGSIPAIAPSPAAIVLWLTPVTLGLASRFAWAGGVEGWVLCVSTILFGTAMARFGLTQHRLLAAGLRSQIERESMGEQLLLQSRDLQRLNRERSRFFASASHDLRQPIHALALFSRALQRDLQGHAALPLADRVVEATDAVSALLNAMLDISKIEAGAVQPVIATVAIDHVFLRLAQIHGERAEAAGLSLRFHTVSEVVATDGDLVFRILSNFTDNALKYCQRGGILISARPRGDQLRLAVWDTGRGIRPEHMPLLFDEFYQVDNANRDASQGLGIGLAIVKRLAPLLGARLGVRSVPGRGSVFWMDLPRGGPMLAAAPLSPPPRDAEAPIRPAAPARAPRVLLLDDERGVGEAMRVWLQPHCERIDVTQTLEAALSRVGQADEGFDVFIVDFRLAGATNGIEATRALRARAGRMVPAILVTGDTDPARVRSAYDSGLVVLFKPVQPDHLLDTLHAALNADRELTSRA
ncbi:ATP-binding response regulator [Variovorax sp. PAMC 28711]|uniref:ATP-binding response regulator n=1 Tax=Variovorax sp. PAMC 28711 TaxID=1795631 RepID=UPI00078DEC8D|nr:hybrid sensor histidine kinase/response regulator [Variovorax sp. PAMC 28711]AMM23240.1 hypothetical protein AX767_01750 [Variovorax sp. PAMC 28711]